MTIQGPDGHVYTVADAHTHIYKQKIAAKATHAIGSFYDAPMYEPEPTATTLLADGGTLGIDHFLVFSVATTPKQVAGINEFIAAEVATRERERQAALAAGATPATAAPGALARFTGLGTAHADTQDWDGLFEQLAELGLSGVKLHPDMQHFPTDDPRLEPLYAGLEARGLSVTLHVGDERMDNSAPERLVRVLERHPNLRVHAAHFGCCRIWKRRPVAIAAAVRAGADIVFDTSSAISWMTDDEARYLVDLLGPERVMWGTDFPMWSPRGEFDRLMALGFDHATNHQLLHGTFARFYGA